MSGYLRKMWKTFLLFLSFCGILGLTFWLYGCSLEPVFYGAALCMIPAAGAFLYGWNRFRKEKEQLERIKALLPLELETLPKPEDERDELLQQIICRLNQMRMDAEEKRVRSHQEMTDYYTMWVHQIKTPIAALRLILSENTEKNRSAVSELFRVEEYVEMVLGYLRTEDMSSDMQFKECSLESIIREQIHKYASVFIGKKLKLDYAGVEERVLTDPKWLGFVIGQCLSNGLKYTKTGGIRIYLSESRPHTLVIRDTGIGIRSEDLPRIFEKGFTGCNGRCEEHSTGIGLYLARKIMHKMNQDITVESEPGQGTEVYLYLGRPDGELF